MRVLIGHLQKVSSLTTSLVLTLRKAVSLVLSVWWFSGFEQVGSGLITGGSLVLRESNHPLRVSKGPSLCPKLTLDRVLSWHATLLAHLWPTITTQEGCRGAASRVKEGPVDWN